MTVVWITQDHLKDSVVVKDQSLNYGYSFKARWALHTQKHVIKLIMFQFTFELLNFLFRMLEPLLERLGVI